MLHKTELNRQSVFIEIGVRVNQFPFFAGYHLTHVKESAVCAPQLTHVKARTRAGP